MGTWLDLGFMHQAKAEALLFQSAKKCHRGLLAHIPGLANGASLGQIVLYLGI